MKRTLSTLSGILGLLVVARDASALGPIDLELGAKVGAATNPDTLGPNPYGLGAGGRAGVGLFNFYGGLSYVHYFGGSTTNADAPSLDLHGDLLGAEVGYTIKAIPVIDIRPQVGLGNATFSATSGSVSTSSSKLYVEPGVTVLVPLGLLFVGADANALIVPSAESAGGGSKTFTSFSAHGQVGIRL